MPADNAPPDHDPRDEAIALHTERHLEALAAGHVRTDPLPDADAECRDLLSVVERLHGLSSYLGDAGAPARQAPTHSLADPARDTADHQAAPAERVGKYRVVRPLGAGGQAAACLAFDPDLRRHVVVKRYHAGRDRGQQVALLQEGQALVRVRSPYVAQCHTAERDDEGPYLVVEYIPGRNLAQALQAGPVSLDRALELTACLAEGLAAVHACGLLHRDLKPANVMIGDDGLPRLVDFGLASPLAGEGLAKVSGTLPYMAPEQARGEVERIDPRSDVYGLGAVLYEMLTGGPPHRHRDQEALWQAVRAGGVVPAAERNPAVPAAVNALCSRCLAPDPSRRFASAAELLQAVRHCQRRLWRARLLRAPRLFLAAAAAVLLLAAAWAVGSALNVPPEDNGTPSDTGGEVRLAVKTSSAPDTPKGGLPEEVKRPAAVPLPVRLEAVGGQREKDGTLVLTDGQNVTFEVTVGQDAYVGLWYVDDKGVVLQLFPSHFEPDNLVPAGKKAIPGNRKYYIRASTSQGPEKVILFASTRSWNIPEPIRLRKGVGPGQGYIGFVTPDERDEFWVLLRGLQLVPRPQGDTGGPLASATLEVPLSVRPRS